MVDGESGLTRLRLLSYNVQGGIDSSGYHAYLLHSWKHVLPYRRRLANLEQIAGLIGAFDLVALQEVDGGSLRTGYVDQTAYLAASANFPVWHKQVNRELGRIARHSNGFLCRMRPRQVASYALPGLPGRGALVAEFGGEDGLRVCMLHLALGQLARRRQLGFVTELLGGSSRLAVMGDLNCDCDAPEIRAFARALDLVIPDCLTHSFPSWRPKRRLDHIMVSRSLVHANPQVIDYPLSDHLPVSLDLWLPAAALER